MNNMNVEVKFGADNATRVPDLGLDDFLEAALAIFPTPQPDTGNRTIRIQKREQLETYGKIQNDIKQLQNLKKGVSGLKNEMAAQNKIFHSEVAKMMTTDFEIPEKKIIPIKAESSECRNVKFANDPMQDVLDSIFILED